jgi:hypothetical protein
MSKKIRPRITKDEAEMIYSHRALLKECEINGLPIDSVSSYWYKGEHFSINVKNNQPSYQSIKDSIISEMDEHSPKYEYIERFKLKDGHCLVLDPADIHIGKLASSFETGEDYNEQIAVKRVLEGVEGILQKAQGFNIDKIVFIGGNDILHIDNIKNSTTAGTVQNTSGMWYDNFLIAKRLYVEVLEKLMSVADVHFVFNPSNHDYMSGFFLADVIKSWFRNSKNITFDCSIAHRKGFKYGINLIGTTHGDGAKIQDLPLLMAQEFPVWWSETKHRYVYTHHVHHKTSKDFIGVTVESLRSPSGTDSWHHRNGYQHSPKAIEAFLHHKKHGQVARLTHLF